MSHGTWNVQKSCQQTKKTALILCSYFRQLMVSSFSRPFPLYLNRKPWQWKKEKWRQREQVFYFPSSQGFCWFLKSTDTDYKGCKWDEGLIRKCSLAELPDYRNFSPPDEGKCKTDPPWDQAVLNRKRTCFTPMMMLMRNVWHSAIGQMGKV